MSEILCKYKLNYEEPKGTGKRFSVVNRISRKFRPVTTVSHKRAISNAHNRRKMK